MLPQRKIVSFVLARFWPSHSILYLWLFYAISIVKTLCICKGDYSATSYGTENLFSSSLRRRMELLKYFYFYAQKSKIKAGNSKFQDLINVPRTLIVCQFWRQTVLSDSLSKATTIWQLQSGFQCKLTTLQSNNMNKGSVKCVEHISLA